MYGDDTMNIMSVRISSNRFATGFRLQPMASTVDSLHPPTRGVLESAIADPASRDIGTRPSRVSLRNLPRELGRIVGDQPGPTLLCIGGLHGNEPAGVLAIQRVMERLTGASEHLRGELIGVVGNRHALGVARR